ncbi:hypothetical protein C8R46DRAFT_461314 [Mycena filopes]|nr:hypothetical protein C8R46DRAFT_461314 [Mycena filopes]
MHRPKRLCTFFQEGRCRYGQNCYFSHSPPVSPIPDFSGFASTSFAGALRSTLTRPSLVSPPPVRARVYEVDVIEDTPKLVQAINVLRRSAGKAPLARTNKFFKALEVAVCRLDEDELEETTQGIIDSLPVEYEPESDPEDGRGYGYSDEESDDGDMDLFSPLKKTTPEYDEPTFSVRQTASYERNSYSVVNNMRQERFFDWDLVESASVINLKFGPNFSIEDSHIAGLTARPLVCRRLQRFAAGDADTGCGYGVHNEGAFIQFVGQCSSIRVFRLEAFTSLSDATLLAIFESCPHIEMVQLTGHDKVHGRLTSGALRTLARMPTWAPRLKALYLYDQGPEIDRGVKALSAARPTVWITTGDGATGGDDGFAQTWLGGKIVRIG